MSVRVLILLCLASLLVGAAARADESAGQLVVKGNQLMEQRKFQDAMTALNKAIELDPRSAEAFMSRGNLWRVLDSYDKALQDYDKAVALAPRNANCYANRGNTRFALGNAQGALDDFSKAIQLDPRNGRFYAYRAQVAMKAGDDKGALPDLTQAWNLSHDTTFLFNRGNCYLRLGEKDKARQDYQKVLQVGSKDPRVTEGARKNLEALK